MEKKVNVNTRFNVLCLQNDPEDFETINGVLNRAKYDFRIDCVDSKKTFKASLLKGEHDIVLADNNSEDIDVFEALDLMLEIDLDLPFVAYIGSLELGKAIQLVKKGAVDIVLKENPKRLADVVKKAFEDSSFNKERRLAEESIKRNEKRFQNIFNSMSEGFSIQDVICDDDGNPIDLRFVEANPAFERQTGLKNSETLGHTLLGLFPSSETYWVERYGKVGITGEPITFEAMFGPLDIYYHVNAFQTAPRQFGVLFTDINERKLHEIELTKAKERAEESERNLKRGQQLAHMGFWKLNVEEKVISGSDELLEIFEIDKEDLSLDNFMQKVHPDDRANALKVTENGIEHGQAWDIEQRLLFKDGRTKWVHAIGEPLIIENKKVEFIVGIVQDITERKNSEDKITDQLDELRSWHNAMLNREERSMELKKEVNDLLIEAGRPIRYSNSSADELES